MAHERTGRRSLFFVSVACMLVLALLSEHAVAQFTGPIHTRILHQEIPGFYGENEDWDNFGNALATGDFNGDGYLDLALGSRGESHGTLQRDGEVVVMYGSATGLSTDGLQRFHQETPGIPGTPTDLANGFGMSLATGDFTTDGIDDLAIGIRAAGRPRVLILQGSSSGLTTEDATDVPLLFPRHSASPGGLAVGDFNGDGIDDLAAATTAPSGGLVSIAYFSAAGIRAIRLDFFPRAAPGLPSRRNPTGGDVGGSFGAAMVTGDFNGDDIDDLAVASAGDVVGAPEPGNVIAMYGSADGLSTTGSQEWNQDTPGIGGIVEPIDALNGMALASGDFNGDDIDDLAFGLPHEDIRRVRDAGAAVVIFGSDEGLSATGNQLLHQNTAGMPGLSERLDEFSSSLAAGDFDGDGIDDLAIGIPREETGSDPYADSGAVTVLPGSSSGLSVDGARLMHQNTPGIAGYSEEGDRWGAALAAGDFNGDGTDELVVNAPNERIGTTGRSHGAVTIVSASPLPG